MRYWRTLLLGALFLLATVVVQSQEAPVFDDGQVETLNGVDYTHRYAQAAGLDWHYVEIVGGATALVFLHGLPESWYSWHPQMAALADSYHVIAPDMKGYGLSDKSEGSYHPDDVAQEIAALLSEIGVEQFHLVTHDWGTLVGDSLAAQQPERVLRYVRMQAPLTVIDPDLHPQFTLFQNQELAANVFREAETFVRAVYARRTVQPVPEADLERIVLEFGREGVAQAVPRYFRDFHADEELTEARAALYEQMTMPVLLLQADGDPAQPLWYFQEAETLFPDAHLQILADCGHFSPLEQPQAVSEAIRDFLEQEALATTSASATTESVVPESARTESFVVTETELNDQLAEELAGMANISGVYIDLVPGGATVRADVALRRQVVSVSVTTTVSIQDNNVLFYVTQITAGGRNVPNAVVNQVNAQLIPVINDALADLMEQFEITYGYTLTEIRVDNTTLTIEITPSTGE